MDKIPPPQSPPKPTFKLVSLPISHQKALKVHGLEIGYDKVLLPKISFEVKMAEKVAITGFNGIGKSTLLLQICKYLDKNLKILYASGEESKRQIKMRASRLNVFNENLYLLTQTDVSSVAAEVEFTKPDILIVDSIQTMNNPDSSSLPGSVSQVKECTNIFLNLSKNLDITTIMIGHVNKDGAIAGPKVLEHMVDTVLYFEGDNQTSYRILRAVKNRHGSTNEMGVF
ncbi:MAG: ATP-binding cassette domain-containing protein, partial [Clostridia bacterium]|nr:ATP-binding cassette domain-containing protein [Clostridia bacterium]